MTTLPLQRSQVSLRAVAVRGWKSEWTPKTLARKPYFIMFIRAPRLKCTSLTLTILAWLAACAPSRMSSHALFRCRSTNNGRNVRESSKHLQQYRELCASTTGVDVAHRRFIVDHMSRGHQRETPTRLRSDSEIARVTVRFCLSRTIPKAGLCLE